MPGSDKSSEEQKQQQQGSRGFLDSIASMSGDAPGGRFWRKQKLGSGDYTLEERTTTETAEGDGDGGGSDSVNEGVSTEYRTYKRRWFGLAQLTLMNIIVSWDVSHLTHD